MDKAIASIAGLHTLERYAPLYGLMQVGMFIIGCVFWVEASSGASSFSPVTWGDFAYSFPAQFWAFVNMFAAFVTLIGLINPVHRRMVAFGGCVHLCQHVALAYSAAMTGGDLAVALYASLLLIPIHLSMTAGALARWKLN